MICELKTRKVGEKPNLKRVFQKKTSRTGVRDFSMLQYGDWTKIAHLTSNSPSTWRENRTVFGVKPEHAATRVRFSSPSPPVLQC